MTTVFFPTVFLLSQKKSHRSLVRSDSEWRTFFFPLNMLERVDLTYIDPTWKRIVLWKRFTLRLQTLYMIWWYLGSEIKNQNLSILTSLKVKVTNEINLRTTFSRRFFFWERPLVELFGDQWVFFAEFVSIANRENHQKSSELIWGNSMWSFFW